VRGPKGRLRAFLGLSIKRIGPIRAHGYSLEPMTDQFVLLDRALIPTVAP
jgi:hypothetical protein